MKRRNFLLNLLLSTVSFVFGYKVGNSNIKSSSVLSEELAQTPNKKTSFSGDKVLNLSAYDVKVNGTDQSARLNELFGNLTGGETVIFPKGANEQDKLGIANTVVISANNVRFELQSGSGYLESRIKGLTPNMTMFSVTGYGFKSDKIVLEGDATGSLGEGATITGFDFLRGDGTSNIDGELHKMRFSKLKQAVYGKGKNLTVENCDFDTGINGIFIEQLSGQENRGHRLNGNRFHSMGGDSSDTSVAESTCISIIGDADLTYKNQINNNYGDGIKKFYEGVGSETTFIANTLPWCRGQGFKITYADSNCQIIGNQIQDRYTGAGATEGGGIEVNNGTGLILSANAITGKKGHSICLVNTTRSNIFENEIIDGDWDNTGTIDAIYLDATSMYNTLIGNTIDTITAGKNGVRYGINLQGNENGLGINFIRSFVTAAILDAKTSNRGIFGAYNAFRRIIYADTLANGQAYAGTPAIGDIIVLNAPSEGNPCEYRYQSGSWKMTKQAGIKRNNTATRPTGSGTLGVSETGLLYYDTTLNKLIVWNSTAWADMTGATV